MSRLSLGGPGATFIRAILWFVFISRLATHSQAQEKTTYQDQLLPLIENNCGKCHNPDKRKGDLDLTSYNGLLKGGGSGQVVVSGNLDSSKLWKAITHAEEPTMPPNKKLADKEIDVFKRWILGGLLETSGSKAIVVNKPAVDFSLKSASIGKPEGPPPMPNELPLDPVVHTAAGNPLAALASSPWAPLTAVAGQKQILLYHSDSLQLLGVLPFTEGQPWDLKFSRSGKLLLAGGGHGGKSGRVLVWDVTTGERLTTVGDEYDVVLAADISPDQSKIALGGPGRLVKLYSTATGELLHKIKKHTDWVTALAFSPNGEWLATADRNGGISLWDPDNAQEVFTLAGHKSGVTALSWRGDSKIIASSSEDGTVKWWETQDGKQVKIWTAHSGGALSVCFSPDGRLVTCGRDNAITTWDASANKLKSFEFFGEMPLRAAFSHDGARVFATDFSGRVAAWNSSDSKRLGELDANPASLGEQIAALQKKIAELEAAANKPSPAVVQAETGAIRAAEALEQARAALDQAKLSQTEKETDYARLKELAAQTPPPPEAASQAAAAREVRFTARVAFTNANQRMEAAQKESQAAKVKLDVAKKENDPAEALAMSRSTLVRLKAAQSFTGLFRAREELASKRREHEKRVAFLAEKQEAARKLQQDLDAPGEPAAKAKLRAALKAASADARMAETAASKAASESALEQARVEKLQSEFERARKASALTAPAEQHSKL